MRPARAGPAHPETREADCMRRDSRPRTHAAGRLVREGETGWAYHTPAELAARAAALPKGHQLAAMRQNARRAVQPYTKEQFGLSVVRLYAAALGRKHAARSAAGGNVA